MRILLIDDHVSFCEGLKAAMMAVARGYEVDFEAGAELLPKALVNSDRYDLFIVDLMMPGLGGIDLLRYLNDNNNQTPVIILSSVQDRELIRQAFQMGAIGFLPKSYSVYQIIDAIEQCREGNIHIPPFLAAGIASDTDAGFPAGSTGLTRKVADEDARHEAPLIAAAQLTRRQLEILSLMDQGLSNQEIADALYISKATVKTHANHLFKIFQANNRITCLRAAKKAGLVGTSS